ncbi:hypothetical protein CHUAL_006644 [Chamberlinius hualienensis]
MKRWMSTRCNPNNGNLSASKNLFPSSPIQCENFVHPLPPIRFIYAALFILFLGIVILTCNVYQLQSLQIEHRMVQSRIPMAEAQGHNPIKEDLKQHVNLEGLIDRTKPTACIYGQHLEKGYLNHVIDIFQRIGYNIITNPQQTSWDVLWTHDYPFFELGTIMKSLKSHQKVNHFPGSGYITNKVNLATSNSPFIPVAFKMPHDKDSFLNYVKDHPDKLFVQKNNKHRGIKVQPISSLNLTQDGSFIQEFIQNPLLIDKRKFDIGIYTIITSIDPLRAYIFNGDALLRFCSVDYHPFNSDVMDKYVVGDDYTPIWEIPSLKYYYQVMGYTMKESFNAYFSSKGKNPKLVWNQIEEAIRQVLFEKEQYLISLSKQYKSSRHFYEMVRFDFAVDEDFKVFIMEANMSPNLSSTHFAQNRLLYEQVIYNTFSLLGLANWLHLNNLAESDDSANQMRVSDRDLAVNSTGCKSNDCHDISRCYRYECQLCSPCIDQYWKKVLTDAFQENRFKHNCRRIIPPSWSGNGNETQEVPNKILSHSNQKMYNWFKGKCQQDISFC